MEILNAANLSTSWLEPLEANDGYRVPGGHYAVILHKDDNDTVIFGTAEEMETLAAAFALRFSSIAYDASKPLEAERFLLTENAAVCPACNASLALPAPGSIFGELHSTIQQHIYKHARPLENS